MTVSSDLNRISYTGNGTTTVFPVNYYFLENSHLLVVLRSAAGVETVQTQTTNYTVTGAGNKAGGSVTMLVAPPVGTTLVIERRVPATQETDYLANDPFPAESHERALDKLTMLVQQGGAGIARSIKIPVTETNNTQVPNSLTRASRLLGFAGNGDVSLSGSTIPQVDAAVAAINTIASAPAGNSASISHTAAGTGATPTTVQAKLRETASTVSTIADLRNETDLTVGPVINVAGYYEAGDGGGGPLRVWKGDEAPGTYTDNGGSIIIPTYGDGSGAWVFAYDYGAKPEDFGLFPDSTTSSIPITSDIAESRVFLDNLRQFNHHTPGATTGQHNFLIPDDTFRIAEVPRSIDKPVAECKKVLFIGDSLTAYNAADGSYTNEVAKKLQEIHGGIAEGGYFAAEPNDISAKQQFFGFNVTVSSGSEYFSTTGRPYTDEVRRFSPDGKGVRYAAGTGAEIYHWNFSQSDKVRYTKYRIYWLRKPGGGTFKIQNRGSATVNTINTDGTLGMIYSEYNYLPPSPEIVEYKDIRAIDITGDVTIYGVELIDESVTDGFSFDTFAISGGALFELVSLENGSLNTYMNSRKPDTVVINIGTNDGSQGRTVAQFTADLNTYLTRITNSVSGDYDVKFVIVNPNNMQWTNFTGSIRAAFEDARRAYARTNEHMYIDLPSEVGNYNYFVNLGWMRDGTHPNIKGQQVIGLRVAKKLLQNYTPSIFNSEIVDLLTDRRVQATANFYYDGASLVVENNVYCTVTRVDVGTYDVAFSGKRMTDNFYTVAITPNAVNRVVYVQTKAATSFRIVNTNLSFANIELESRISFEVIGTSIPRK